MIHEKNEGRVELVERGKAKYIRVRIAENVLDGDPAARKRVQNDEGGHNMFKIHKGRWLYPVLVGFILTIIAGVFIIPLARDRVLRKGSLYVSIVWLETPKDEVPGLELSELQLIRVGEDEPAKKVDPQKGWYRWKGIEKGTYDVKIYVNDMYAGIKEDIEVQPWKETTEIIHT